MVQARYLWNIRQKRQRRLDGEVGHSEEVLPCLEFLACSRISRQINTHTHKEMTIYVEQRRTEVPRRGQVVEDREYVTERRSLSRILAPAHTVSGRDNERHYAAEIESQ
jgi:hypothetical protein